MITIFTGKDTLTSRRKRRREEDSIVTSVIWINIMTHLTEVPERVPRRRWRNSTDTSVKICISNVLRLREEDPHSWEISFIDIEIDTSSRMESNLDRHRSCSIPETSSLDPLRKRDIDIIVWVVLRFNTKILQDARNQDPLHQTRTFTFSNSRHEDHVIENEKQWWTVFHWFTKSTDQNASRKDTSFCNKSTVMYKRIVLLILQDMSMNSFSNTTIHDLANSNPHFFDHKTVSSNWSDCLIRSTTFILIQIPATIIANIAFDVQ